MWHLMTSTVVGPLYLQKGRKSPLGPVFSRDVVEVGRDIRCHREPGYVYVYWTVSAVGTPILTVTLLWDGVVVWGIGKIL